VWCLLTYFLGEKMNWMPGDFRFFQNRATSAADRAAEITDQEARAKNGRAQAFFPPNPMPIMGTFSNRSSSDSSLDDDECGLIGPMAKFYTPHSLTTIEEERHKNSSSDELGDEDGFFKEMRMHRMIKERAGEGLFDISSDEDSFSTETKR
jgi:hypothetical protein